MKYVKIVYDNPKDRELVEIIDTKLPIFIELIDYNTKHGKKEAYKLKSQWAARLNPFVMVTDKEGKVEKIFYSENGNAINQLIKFLNEGFNKEIE